MTSGHQKVLIVDDDPSHLEIYGLLMQQAGYDAVSALVRFAGAEVPRDHEIGLVLLDYKLHSLKTSAEFAQEIRALFPGAPIIVLSDLWSLPDDIAPFTAEFVRKGQPAKLLEVVGRLLPLPETELKSKLKENAP
ncbi:MAG TPA: response regulator [Terracidiphilus sp.]|jgi:DNA-binding response OmpR family regulator|nr:response regulator [Terracidiphilus sp.]